MLTRISDNLKFNTMADYIFKIQTKYAELEEKLASQKAVNRPSDDPVGMSKILDYRASQAAINTYQRNAKQSESWLTMTEAKLTSMLDLLVKAKEIALSQGSATADSSSRKSAAVAVQSLIDEMLSLANSKMGDRYLFAGSDTSVKPFSSALGEATVGEVQAAGGNAFDGTVVSGGTYTGDVNKTYVVEIVRGGTLADAVYRISSDGGRTWGSEQSDLDLGTITLGDGITLTFTDNGSSGLSTGDLFSVRGTTAGYYQGNGGSLTLETSKGIDFIYNVTGEAALTDRGGGTVDVLAALHNLKAALEGNNAEGIRMQLDNLDAGHAQISKHVSSCGSKMMGLEITTSNLDALETKITELVSGVEDADMASLMIEFTMKEVALKASYALSGQLAGLSILDFIR
jgi:flagellar hook-associated protein 3 FlgL